MSQQEMTPLVSGTGAPAYSSPSATDDAPVASLRTTPTYTVSPTRWMALLHLALLNAGQSTQAVVFSAVPKETEQNFGVSTVQVDTLSAVYMVTFVAAVPFVTWLFLRIGQRNALRIASLCSLAGWACRLLVAVKFRSFAGLFVSQILLGITNTFVFVAPALLASTWFGDHERTLATAIGAISSSVGLAIGQLLPPFMLQRTPRTLEEAWLLLFLLEASYVVVDVPLIWCFVPPGPPTPPSAAEEAKDPVVVATFAREEASMLEQLDGHDTESSGGDEDAPVQSLRRVTRGSGTRPLRQQLKSAFGTHAFVPVLLVCAVINGGDLAVTALLPQMLRTSALSEEWAGVLGCAQAAIGAVAVIPFSLWMDRHRLYHVSMRALLAVSAVLYVAIGLAFFAKSDIFASVFTIPFVTLGVCQACMLPLAIEFAVELTFPINTTLVSSSTIAVAYAAALLLLLLLPLPGGNTMTWQSSMGSFGLLALFACALLAVLSKCKPRLHRLQFERFRRFGTDRF